MNNDNQHRNRSHDWRKRPACARGGINLNIWQPPEITTLSISRDTAQNGPLDPPDAGIQNS